ncbi:MAG: DedA family protein [Steroidobacteraceae bacterium]
MDLQFLLQHYGYLAVFGGTFFEGESLLLLGSYAAHRGYLQLPWVIAVAFAAAVASDQIYFHLGRRHGVRYVRQHPRLAARVEAMLRRVERRGTWLVLVMRFLWGMRVALPVAVGMSGMSPRRFLLLDVLSAAGWATTIGFIGFSASRLLSGWINDLHRHETLIVVVLIALAAAAIGWRWRAGRKVATPEPPSI